MTAASFESRYGFRRAEVNLDNWRTRPYSAWSFQNVAEIVPSALVSGPDTEVEETVDPAPLLDRTVVIDGIGEAVSAFLDRSSTDSLVIMKGGAFVADWHAPGVDADAPHLVFSIGKSLTAILAGSLQDEGLLDPSQPVARYVPEAKNSAYGDCTVRSLLDMRVSLDFAETYLDPEGAFARYRKATLWNPNSREQTLLEFLLTLKKTSAEHGGPFRYQSPNSDMLGIVVERASGRRFSQLLRERLLGPIGAKGRCLMTVDAAGTARTAGGVSITARDLARVGEMMRNCGMAGSRAVVSEGWVRDATTGGDRAAWKAGDFPQLFADGSYRSKWYQTGYEGGAFCAIGIHGQWLYVDPPTQTVIVRQSSQHLPEDEPLNQQCLAFLRQLAAMV